MQSAEHTRLEQDRARSANWKRWGAYLSERQWATVREDYSAGGDSWRDFPHEHSRSRAYRWGEDGLLGICDRQCRLCFAPAFWNGRDPILKERLFGLTGPEGNHGEDVKECYYYLDATPTHSYLKALYKYPWCEFPYESLVRRNAEAGREAPEVELEDLSVFEGDRFFDICVEYAKAAPDDILIRLTVSNRGPGDREFLAGGFPEVAPQFHMVGESQGHRRPQPLHWRFPGVGQYRHLRSQPTTARWRAS